MMVRLKGIDIKFLIFSHHRASALLSVASAYAFVGWDSVFFSYRPSIAACPGYKAALTWALIAVSLIKDKLSSSVQLVGVH